MPFKPLLIRHKSVESFKLLDQENAIGGLRAGQREGFSVVVSALASFLQQETASLVYFLQLFLLEEESGCVLGRMKLLS